MKKRILLVALAVVCMVSLIALGIYASEETGLTVDAISLSLKDNVYINYKVKNTKIDSEEVTLLVWTEPDDGGYKKGSEDKILESAGVDEQNRCVFQYKDLAAKQMTDYVYVRAYANVDGTEYYSETVKYSILQYAYNKLGKTGTGTDDRELAELLEAMLDYGAMAQIYNGYRTDTLANDDYYQVKLMGATLPDGFPRGLYKAGTELTVSASGNGSVVWYDSGSRYLDDTSSVKITVGESNAEYTAAEHTHSIKDEVTEATCTEGGYTTHSCACGKNYTDTYVAANGHNEVSEEDKAPTATEAGYIGQVYCSNCDHVFSERIEIPPTGTNITELNMLNMSSKGDTVSYTCSSGSPYFSNTDPDKVTVENNNITIAGGSGHRSLYMTRIMSDGSVAKYQFNAKIGAKSTSGATDAFFVGLRLSGAADNASSPGGLWISLRDKEVGVVSTWGNVHYITIQPSGIDFSTERTIYVEDNMSTDTVTVYANNDSGVKTLVATVKIASGKVELYQPDGTLGVSVTRSINGSGYFSLWGHEMAENTYISNLVVTGTESVTVNMLDSKDVMSDTWISVDDEGRETLTGTKAANDKKVGIFYYLWHDIYDHGDGPNGDLENGEPFNKLTDHSASYLAGGATKLQEDIVAGNHWIGFGQYWGEPYFGYYRSNDEWVIREHTYQLTAAGVDFIIIDVTNGRTYKSTYMKILEIWTKMREEGYDTPQIAFNCGNPQSNSDYTTDPGYQSVMALWNDLYSQGVYEELWFKHDGKPLIFVPAHIWSRLPSEMTNFFTCRYCWAGTSGYNQYTNEGWYAATGGNNCWPWADLTPQGVGKSPTGETEQMIVMCGFWSNGSFGSNAGRSYSYYGNYYNGNYYTGQPEEPGGGNYGFTLTEDGQSGKGIAFQEQFDRALQVDPEIIMITGWNEWWAGIWEGSGGRIANTYESGSGEGYLSYYFVDCFSPEFSRDIEPVKGWFNDNYYYQMAQNIRQFKGSRKPLTAFGQKAININASNTQWYSVGPEYRDYTGDIAWRDCWSFVGKFHYENYSGRNDIATAKVSKDGDFVYFYAECAGNITSPSGTNWMNLFINSDCDYDTGWYGYDYVLNREQSGSTCSVSEFNNDSWSLETIGWAEYKVVDNYIQIKVSASTLGIGNTFDFKWADNSVDHGNIMEFIDLGDAAPNDRFNYRYTTNGTSVDKPSALSNDMIVLKAGSYNAFVGGEMVMLDSSNTRAVFMGDDTGLYVPKAFARDKMGINVSGLQEYNHYGVVYVNIEGSLDSLGKTVTRSDSMVVIANGEVSEENMLILYRALY